MLAHLQVVVVTVGVHLVTSVYIEHRVQTLGGTGILFKLLYLEEIHRGMEQKERSRVNREQRKNEGEQFMSSPKGTVHTAAALNTFKKHSMWNAAHWVDAL